jgi:hypothetical protein
MHVWLVASDASFAMLTKAEDDETPLLINPDSTPMDGESSAPPNKNLTIYERSGSYTHLWYKRRSIKMPAISAKPEQTTIIEEIRAQYSKKGHVVVLLHGPPASGKSMLSLLLASSFRGSYCNTLRPWQPGDTLGGLYTECTISANAPLIVAFDEFDEALVQIHMGIEAHKNLSIQVGNKAGWNQLLDEIQIGMYPHLIVVMTTNKTPEFIREMDTSYIRNGRVDLIYQLKDVYM